MKLEPLTVDHCRALHVQPWQSGQAANLRDEPFMLGLIASGPAWAAVDGGRVLAIGGVVDNGGGRAFCWSFVGAELGAEMIGCFRAAKRVIDDLNFRRIETVTHCDFDAAHRLVKLLGFKFEASLRAWFPDGSAGYMWARINA